MPSIYRDRIRAAAAKVKEQEEGLAEARAELRQALLDARAEGIPLSVLAEHAGLTRERVRQLVTPQTRRRKS